MKHVGAAALGLCIISLAPAQDAAKVERPTSAEFAEYDRMKSGSVPVEAPGDKARSDANRKLFDKVARFLVAPLTDPKNASQGPDNLMWRVIKEAQDRLPIPPLNARNVEKLREFADHIGPPFVRELEPIVLKNSKEIVRINAAHMLALVGATGYDKSAELMVKVIEAPEEIEAVKYWALTGLGNLLAYVEDPLSLDKSPFKRQNRALEHKVIQTLISYIMKPREVPPEMPPDQVAAIPFVRAKAVEALGHARAHTVRFEGNVLARPGLALLKVACADGLRPPPSLDERVEALAGFCQLFPVVRSADRDLQIDYAVPHFGQALLDLATLRIKYPNDQTIPWKADAERLTLLLETWKNNVEGMKFPDAALARELYDRAASDVLNPIKQGTSPNAPAFQQWLQSLKPKAVSLYTTDPAAVIKPTELKTGGR